MVGDKSRIYIKEKAIEKRGIKIRVSEINEFSEIISNFRLILGID